MGNLFRKSNSCQNSVNFNNGLDDNTLVKYLNVNRPNFYEASAYLKKFFFNYFYDHYLIQIFKQVSVSESVIHPKTDALSLSSQNSSSSFSSFTRPWGRFSKRKYVNKNISFFYMYYCSDIVIYYILCICVFLLIQ